MSLSPEKMRRIHEFQRAEIERLATDREFATISSRQPHFSRIGDWLPPKPGARILELGCGPGRYVAMLARLGYDVVGVDPVSYDDWPLIQSKVDVQLISDVLAESLPFQSESFDFVACMGALLYYKDADRAMLEIRRVLKPHGRLIVRNINRTNLYRRIRGRNIDPATTNAYTLDELADFVEARGFAVHEKFAYGFYPPVLPMQWWYLINGPLSATVQQFISKLTPASVRTTVVIFAERSDGGHG